MQPEQPLLVSLPEVNTDHKAQESPLLQAPKPMAAHISSRLLAIPLQ